MTQSPLHGNLLTWQELTNPDGSANLPNKDGVLWTYVFKIRSTYGTEYWAKMLEGTNLYLEEENGFRPAPQGMRFTHWSVG